MKLSKAKLGLLLLVLFLVLIALCACDDNGDADKLPVDTIKDPEVTTPVSLFDFETLPNGAYQITKYNGTEPVVYVPAIYNGKAVTTIAEGAFAEKKDVLTKICFYENITRIDTGAFRGCTALTEITFMTGSLSIGNSAFAGCTGLTELTLSGVVVVGSEAFSGCTGLETVVMPDCVKRISDGAFRNCQNLLSITLGSGISVDKENGNAIPIGTEAFSGCIRLVEIYKKDTSLPTDGGSAVGGLGRYALNVLTSLDAPSGIRKLGDFTFYELTATKDGAAVTEIYLLNYTGEEKTLLLPDYEGKEYTVNEFAFYRSALTSLTLPSTVTHIGDYAFWQSAALASVTLPETLKTIGCYAFGDCTALTSVTIPDSVTAIGTSAFRRCSALATVTVGRGLTSISDYVFDVTGADGKKALTAITFLSPSDWFRTAEYNDWKNETKETGVAVDLSDAAANALTFTNYNKYYWYK